MEEDMDFLNELQELSKQLPPENTTNNHQNQSNNENNQASSLPGFSNDFGEFNLNDFIKNLKMDDTPQLQENLNKLKENLEVISSQLKLSTQFGNPNMNDNNTQSSPENNTNPFINAYYNNNLNQDDFRKQFGSFANEHINNNELNKLFELTKDYIQSDKDKEPNENEQKEMCDKVIDYMLDNNLFKQVFSSMQSSIKANYEKNKTTLTTEDIEQYNNALMHIDNILSEAVKVHPDKALIIDYIFNLQKISMLDLQNHFAFNQ